MLPTRASRKETSRAALALCSVLVSCAGGQSSAPVRSHPAGVAGSDVGTSAVDRVDLGPAGAAIREVDIRVPLETLASDAFEGRAPGSAGQARTLDYLAGAFRALGLAPGAVRDAPRGGGLEGYLQRVPLVGLTATPTAHVTIGGRRFDLTFPDDYVAGSRRLDPMIRVDDAELVFVGYGVRAPEYGWDDYKGLDVRGKALLMLIGDPPVTAPGHPDRLDERVFKGRALTYYGRWTYKFEIAAALGAAAAIIIHDTAGAGYGFDVVQSSWRKETLDVRAPEILRATVPVQAWIRGDRAAALLAAAGQDLERLRAAAARPDFAPVRLDAPGRDARAHFALTQRRRDFDSANVIARFDGRGPHADEYLIYSAHWDHLGRDPSLVQRAAGASGPSLAGDQIYNGALDNASGVAVMLAIARAFTLAPRPPARSVLFIAPTGEEAGLLGMKYYAAHPPYPIPATVADINMDVMNVWGRARSLVSIGLGSSTLDEPLAAAAAAAGRTVVPDPEPEKGYFYRSDHLELLKVGVPALHFLHPGADYVGRPADYGTKRRAAYVQSDYHKVSDEVRPDWDLSGAIEDARLLFETGYRVADAEARPRWKENAEFAGARSAATAPASKASSGRDHP